MFFASYTPDFSQRILVAASNVGGRFGARISPLGNLVCQAAASFQDEIRSSTRALTGASFPVFQIANRTRKSTRTSAITMKDGTQIYHKDWGSGQPVVFSRGWPLSADAFDQIAPITDSESGRNSSGETEALGLAAIMCDAPRHVLCFRTVEVVDARGLLRKVGYANCLRRGLSRCPVAPLQLASSPNSSSGRVQSSERSSARAGTSSRRGTSPWNGGSIRPRCLSI
jgi:hypothetical protein